MEFLLPAIYVLLFAVLIMRWRFFDVRDVSRNLLLALFALKLVAAAVVVWVYTRHYPGGDFFTYFSDSRVLLDRAAGGGEAYSPAWTGNFEDVLFNSAKTMIVLNAALHLFSFGNFYVHVVFFCFFSFIGLTALLKAFLVHFPNKRNRIIIALFLIPSVLFWGSAALKESVVIGIVGLIVALSDFGLKKKYTLAQMLFLVILATLLLFVKFYVLIALLPVMLVNTIVSRSSAKMLWLKYTIVFMLMGGVAFLVGKIHPDYNALELIANKQSKAISEAQGGVFLVSDTHFIRVDYAKQESVLLPVKDSVFRIMPGSAYTQWKLDDMKDTTFVTQSGDTAAFRLLYSIQPARSVIALHRLKPDLKDFLLCTPLAFASTLLHPTVFELSSWLHVWIAVENLWVLLLILLAVIFFDRSMLEQKPVIVFCFVFAILLFVLIGLTTPAIGAMVRYKTIALLFLVIACLLLISREKLRRLFR